MLLTTILSNSVRMCSNTTKYNTVGFNYEVQLYWKGLVVGVSGFFVTILGVVVLFNAFIAGIALPIVLGIVSIIGGLAAIVLAFKQS